LTGLNGLRVTNASQHLQQTRRSGEYPRKFLQVYSFIALFGPNGDTSNLPPIDYDLSQGYVYYTLFNNFESHVKSTKRAELTEVTFASPGYVRFKVNPDIASDFRHAVMGYLADRESITIQAEFIDRWAKDKEEQMTEDMAKKAFTDLCSRIGIKSDQILRSFSNKQAIKAMMSYLRRLQYIATNDEERIAMLVGLER
jgi:hypothetical protein